MRGRESEREENPAASFDSVDGRRKRRRRRQEDRKRNDCHVFRTSFTACARTEAERDEEEAILGCRAAGAAAARGTRATDRTAGAASEAFVVVNDIVACVFAFV